MGEPMEPWSNRMSLDEILSAANVTELDRGRDQYRRFNRFGSGKVIKVRHPRIMPPIVVELGDLLALIYRSEKGRPGFPQSYVHFMENPPRLVSSPEGRQLYIVGGDYIVTARGIEG